MLGGCSGSTAASVGAIAGATATNYGITSVQTTNAGSYTVVVTNAAGSVTSAVAQLYIDSDGDGLPDAWEVRYFGTTAEPMGEPDADWDEDGARNGAEFTPRHISRSAEFLTGYLPRIGLGHWVPVAQKVVHFTGYEMDVDDIKVADPKDRMLGHMVGSADLIGQMSDRMYLEKCREFLYPEFVWGSIARETLPDGRVLLLTNLRYLGYTFNPVSFFYCYGADARLQVPERAFGAGEVDQALRLRQADALPVAL